jgi:hypothetical protein
MSEELKLKSSVIRTLEKAMKMAQSTENSTLIG